MCAKCHRRFGQSYQEHECLILRIRWMMIFFLAAEAGRAFLSWRSTDRTWISLDFAAKMLEIPLKDLTDLVRIVKLEPAGVIRMASYHRRQGRQPRAFRGS